MSDERRGYEKYFRGNKLKGHLERLEALNGKMGDIRTQVESFQYPLLVTFLGCPRTGKTTIALNVYDFLKKCGLKTKFLEEPANAVYKTFKSDEEKKAAIADPLIFNSRLMDFAHNQVDKAKKGNVNSIVCDRGYVDPIVWLMENGNVDKYWELISQKIFEIKKINQKFNTITLSLYADPEKSMERDYLQSLSLAPRKMINPEQLEMYAKSLKESSTLLRLVSDKFSFIDTTDMAIGDVAVTCAEKIVDNIASLTDEQSIIFPKVEPVIEPRV